VDEGTQDSDRMVESTCGEPLKEEGALAVIICAVCIVLCAFQVHTSLSIPSLLMDPIYTT